LPDGQGVDAEPFAAADTSPLAGRLARGDYRVRLCRLRSASGGNVLCRVTGIGFMGGEGED
jgi:hypothetical protein